MIHVERYTPRHIHVKEDTVQKMISKTVFAVGATGSILLSQNVSALPNGDNSPGVTQEVSIAAVSFPTGDEQAVLAPKIVTLSVEEESSAVMTTASATKPVESNHDLSTQWTNVDPYFLDAVQAAELLGWDPLFVYSQWRHETGNFTSNNFIQNNNLAGQTWHPGCGCEKGTARPPSEGGHYIKYASPVDGYVDFVQKSPRYHNVKNLATAEEQAEEVARKGWATDKAYAQKVKKLIQESRAEFGHLLANE